MEIREQIIEALKKIEAENPNFYDIIMEVEQDDRYYSPIEFDLADLINKLEAYKK